MTEFGKLTLAYLGLLLLLALTVGSSLIDLGGFNTAINLGIATAKAAVIVLVFMHLTEDPILSRLVVAAAAMWLAIMYGLTLVGQ